MKTIIAQMTIILASHLEKALMFQRGHSSSDDEDTGWLGQPSYKPLNRCLNIWPTKATETQWRKSEAQLW